MKERVTIKGFAAIERHDADGTYRAYMPRAAVPMPIQAGDRLRLRLEVREDAWIHAIAASRHGVYWNLGTWEPGIAVSDDARIPWPDGRVLGEDDACMHTLYVIASMEVLDWARTLTRAECSGLEGRMAPHPPKTSCDHLYGLAWKVPARVRGRVPPPVERIRYDGTHLPAITARHAGSPYAVIEWLFAPRPS